MSTRAIIRFIILTTARTGSNLLSDLLGSHPRIETLGELYNLNSLNRNERSAVLQDPLGYLKCIMYSPRPVSIQVIGFKLFYYHATRQQLYANSYPDNNTAHMHSDERRQLLEFYDHIQDNYDLKVLEQNLKEVWEHLRSDSELRIIHLKRRNKLAAFLSLRLALKTSHWSKASEPLGNDVLTFLKGWFAKKPQIPIILNHDDCLALQRYLLLFDKISSRFRLCER